MLQHAVFTTVRSCRKNPLHCLLVIALIVLSGAAKAETDYPTYLLGYGISENDQLTGKCQKTSDDRLKCDFVEVQVSRAADPEELEKELIKLTEANLKDFKKGLGTDLCSSMGKMLTGLNSGEAPSGADKKKFRDNILNLRGVHRDDMNNMLQAYVDACDRTTLPKIKRILRLDHDKRMRTCKVWTNRWSEIFGRGESLETSAWVANRGPTGICGVVVISILEDPKKGAGSGHFWTYRTRKVVTNPNAKIGTASCNGLDQNEYLYDWKPRNIHVNCDYIKFGL